MARRRMIDPEFFLDEKLCEVSAYARLLYIGLWQICDDNHATFPNRVKWLKVQIFPYEDIDVAKLLNELKKIGVIVLFTANDGEEYWHIKNFFKYQRVDKPSKSKYPEYSKSTPRVLQEGSPTTPAEVKLSKLSKEKISEEKIVVEEKQITSASPRSLFFEKAKSLKTNIALIAGISLICLFSVGPVNAVTIKQTYKVSSKYARPAVISSVTATEGIRPPAKGTPAVKNTIGGSGRIVSLIKKQFGDDWKVAYAVFRAESGLRANAKGYNCMYVDSYGNDYSAGCQKGDSGRAWSVDCGVAQLNFKGQECPPESLDPVWNIEKAFVWKFKPSGWYPWSAYISGSYLAFLDQYGTIR